MYSVVLLMAVTAGGESPDFGRHGCYGCYGGRGYYGGCYGGGYGGCYGGGYGGCYGGISYGGCYGCGGGISYGGCYGGVSYGSCGVSYGCCGATYGGMMAAPAGGYGQPQPVPPPKKSDGKKEVSNGPAPATVVVSVPADASLLVEGKLTQSTSSLRIFESPDLELGQKYAYTFKAEFSRDGKKVSVTKRVPVTAGARVNVDLTQPVATAVASK